MEISQKNNISFRKWTIKIPLISREFKNFYSKNSEENIFAYVYPLFYLDSLDTNV